MKCELQLFKVAESSAAWKKDMFSLKVQQIRLLLLLSLVHTGD